jgi:hypothetical protein
LSRKVGRIGLRRRRRCPGDARAAPLDSSSTATRPSTTGSIRTTSAFTRSGARAASGFSTALAPPRPQERSDFIPGRSNGVEADTQGLISVIDRLQGFDILEFDGSP